MFGRNFMLLKLMHVGKHMRWDRSPLTACLHSHYLAVHPQCLNAAEEQANSHDFLFSIWRVQAGSAGSRTQTSAIFVRAWTLYLYGCRVQMFPLSPKAKLVHLWPNWSTDQVWPLINCDPLIKCDRLIKSELLINCDHLSTVIHYSSVTTDQL